MGIDFERSLLGRTMISLFMIVIIGSLLLWNLPNARPRQEARDIVGPVLLPIGLDQDWSVFAPRPRDFTVGWLARVTYEDGLEKTWRTPGNGLWLQPYAGYRWQKYNERIRGDDFNGLWDEAARYVAKDAGPGVVRVELFREFRPVVVPGTGGTRPPLETTSFYSLDIEDTE